MFNKQGMIFYVASAVLTNGRYPYIYSSAVVKKDASNRFTNCHAYYFFISGQKLNIPVFRMEKREKSNQHFFLILCATMCIFSYSGGGGGGGLGGP